VSVLNLTRLFSLAIILMLCLSILSVVVSQPNAGGEVVSGVKRIEKAVNFLTNSQFNESLSLCREVPAVAPNTYWLVSDNLWAWKALKLANESRLSDALEAGRIAPAIETKLKEKAKLHNLPKDSNGFPISFMHEAVIGDVIPTPNRTSTNLTLQNDDYVVKTEICNGSIISDWQNYSDRLLYMALSLHWQGNDTAAMQYFENATNSTYVHWDGIGINDTATRANGSYATYKLALLLYVSKVLGRTLPFEYGLVMRIWSLQRETDGGIITNYYANGTTYGDTNTETTSIVIIAMLTAQKPSMGTFAFYYPWYGTLDISGNWSHWPPDGRTRITDHPILGFYDSNNESLIKEHIGMAKEAGIDGFIVSWWGINSFTDNATLHIRNVCEQNNFTFTIYYENTSSIDQTINDLKYILNNYASSSAWYKIDGRPVIYIYKRALENLNPRAWNLHGNYSPHWKPLEDIRKPPRCGIFQIHPYPDGIGYVESGDNIFLPPNETYKLKVSISDIRNDCSPDSDVGFRIQIKNETESWKTLQDLTVNFNDGWLDLSYNVSDYAGQNVWIKVESYDGGVRKWCSEWAAVDYFYIENSEDKIVSPEPFFDNWKTVIDESKTQTFNPYIAMDFTEYHKQIQYFLDYFSDSIDGVHVSCPLDISMNLTQIFHEYDQASKLAKQKGKSFVATVMPGFNDTNKPLLTIDRQNGTFYSLLWSIAKACLPEGYAITSFNEWQEGTEIEPSLEYGYQYIDLTKALQTMWTAPFNIEVVGNSAVSDFNINVLQKTVSFNVSGLKNTQGFCNVTLPNIIAQELWNDNYTVLLNGGPWPFRNWTDATNAYIYINYTHSEHEIIIMIIPEFPSTIIIPLFMLTTLIATVLLKKKRKPKSTTLICLLKNSCIFPWTFSVIRFMLFAYAKNAMRKVSLSLCSSFLDDFLNKSFMKA